MGNKKKKTGYPDGLWSVNFIDLFNPDDSFKGEAATKEVAEAEYKRLTSNETQYTYKTRNQDLSYYILQQFS
jgi:hypothetical protein